MTSMGLCEPTLISQVNRCREQKLDASVCNARPRNEADLRSNRAQVASSWSKTIELWEEESEAEEEPLHQPQPTNSSTSESPFLLSFLSTTPPSVTSVHSVFAHSCILTLRFPFCHLNPFDSPLLPHVHPPNSPSLRFLFEYRLQLALSDAYTLVYLHDFAETGLCNPLFFSCSWPADRKTTHIESASCDSPHLINDITSRSYFYSKIFDSELSQSFTLSPPESTHGAGHAHPLLSRRPYLRELNDQDHFIT